MYVHIAFNIELYKNSLQLVFLSNKPPDLWCFKFDLYRTSFISVVCHIFTLSIDLYIFKSVFSLRKSKDYF